MAIKSNECRARLSNYLNSIQLLSLSIYIVYRPFVGWSKKTHVNRLQSNFGNLTVSMAFSTKGNFIQIKRRHLIKLLAFGIETIKNELKLCCFRERMCVCISVFIYACRWPGNFSNRMFDLRPLLYWNIRIRIQITIDEMSFNFLSIRFFRYD